MSESEELGRAEKSSRRSDFIMPRTYLTHHDLEYFSENNYWVQSWRGWGAANAERGERLMMKMCPRGMD